MSIFDSWELISLVVDGTFVLISYYYYHKTSKELELLSEALIYELDDNLIASVYKSPSKYLPYVCVCGTVKAEGAVISSEYISRKGVIKNISTYEHRAKRIQSTWFDQKREVDKNRYSVPFVLTNTKTNIDIKIKDALSSDYLLDSLQIIHDSYKPAQTDTFGKVVEAVAGEVVKGHSKTERMLLIGSPLTAFGMVKFNRDMCLVLKPPIDGTRYILSTMKRSEIIDDVKDAAMAYKIITGVFIGIGGIIFIIWLRKIYKKIRDSLERKKAASSIISRDSAAADVAIDHDDTSTSTCIVCLNASRNILLLPCRHIVTCEACTDALPQPKQCPVCRETFENHLPIYLS